MCAVVRLRALMARQAARLITNPPIDTQYSFLATLAALFVMKQAFFLRPLVTVCNLIS
jgi:hypothetical protein